MKSSDQVSNGTSLWQLIILVLCIYVLLVLAVETFLELPQEIRILLGRIDNIICYIFVGDFLYNVIGSKK